MRSARGRVAVWAPYALIAERSDIEESWRLTSDSLALWLGRPARRRALLPDQVDRAAPGAQFERRQLARDGVVDEAFPAMLRSRLRRPSCLAAATRHAFAACALPGR